MRNHFFDFLRFTILEIFRGIPKSQTIAENLGSVACMIMIGPIGCGVLSNLENFWQPWQFLRVHLEKPWYL